MSGRKLNSTVEHARNPVRQTQAREVNENSSRKEVHQRGMIEVQSLTLTAGQSETYDTRLAPSAITHLDCTHG
jgi:hypothetical protein